MSGSGKSANQGLRLGAVAKPPRVLAVRSLRKEDLARLAEPRGRAYAVKRMRDSHHHLARLFASGLDNAAVAQRVGYSIHRVRIIRQSPAFAQLVDEYRALVNEAWVEGVDDYFELATANMVRAEMQIADRLGDAEDEGVPLPIRDLLAISRDAADRFGYGKRSTSVNVNADFAALLEKAIRRSDAVRLSATDPPAAAPAGATTVSPPAVVAPFRRRA